MVYFRTQLVNWYIFCKVLFVRKKTTQKYGGGGNPITEVLQAGQIQRHPQLQVQAT